jgi:hypothetical protein
VPLLEPKVIVDKNGRKVRIYIVNESDFNSYNSNRGYNSDYLIRFYSPDSNSDSDLKELVY